MTSISFHTVVQELYRKEYSVLHNRWFYNKAGTSTGPSGYSLKKADSSAQPFPHKIDVEATSRVIKDTIICPATVTHIPPLCTPAGICETLEYNIPYHVHQDSSTLNVLAVLDPTTRHQKFPFCCINNFNNWHSILRLWCLCFYLVVTATTYYYRFF